MEGNGENERGGEEADRRFVAAGSTSGFRVGTRKRYAPLHSPASTLHCTMAAIAAPLFERGPLTEGVRSSGGFLLNVKLPARVDPERAHLTRFQSRAPPQLAGEVFTVNCKESDTVEQLKNAVKGARSARLSMMRISS